MGEFIRRRDIEKLREKRNTVNMGRINEFEFLSKEFRNYINKIDISNHTKGHLHMLLQKFYRDVMLNEILKREVFNEGRNED